MGDSFPSRFEGYDRYIDEHFDAMVAELREVCSRPTLAGQRVGIDEGTSLVRGLLEPLGAYVKEVPLGGAPPLMIGELGQETARSCCTTTTTCSRRSRSNCGTRPPTRATCATGDSTPGASLTTGATSFRACSFGDSCRV